MKKQDILNYKFSAEEITKLTQYRDKQTDARLKLRFVALLMLTQGIDHKIIVNVVGKSLKTLERWVQQYTARGIDSLNSFQYVPKKT